MPVPRAQQQGIALSGLVLLCGCGLSGAPTFSIAGAYFPAWLLCGLIGVLTAVALRIVFLLVGIDALLSFRLFTYVALGTIAGLLVWLFGFGP